MRRSISLNDKLNNRLLSDPTMMEFDQLLQHSMSACKFNSKRELAAHLSEGALLNIGKLGSKALSVPCGDYMVWLTDAGHTMLVPVGTSNVKSDVLENKSETYDLFTKVLLQNWNNVNRTLAESTIDEAKADELDIDKFTDSDDEKESEEEDEEEDEDEEDDEDEDEDEDEEEEDEEDEDDDEKEEKDKFEDDSFSGIHTASVDRRALMRAMEDNGYTVSSLADELGVDPSTISRLLRTPKERQGDPGGRNPSIGMASAVTRKLRLSPNSLFPDIFGARGADEEYKPKDVKANKASGDR